MYPLDTDYILKITVNNTSKRFNYVLYKKKKTF